MDAIILYQPGDMTPEGDPMLFHPGPGCIVVPHPLQPKTKSLVVQGGQKFTVRGDWATIATKAGYGKLVKAMKKMPPVQSDEPAKPEPTSSPPPESESKPAAPAMPFARKHG